MDLGVGKSATAQVLQCAAQAYSSKGFKYVKLFQVEVYPCINMNRFYYADERQMDGSAAGMGIDGAAHAQFYVQLASGQSQQSWHQTFIKGQGYKVFDK